MLPLPLYLHEALHHQLKPPEEIKEGNQQRMALSRIIRAGERDGTERSERNRTFISIPAMTVTAFEYILCVNSGIYEVTAWPLLRVSPWRVWLYQASKIEDSEEFILQFRVAVGCRYLPKDGTNSIQIGASCLFHWRHYGTKCAFCWRPTCSDHAPTATAIKNEITRHAKMPETSTLRAAMSDRPARFTSIGLAAWPLRRNGISLQHAEGSRFRQDVGVMLGQDIGMPQW